MARRTRVASVDQLELFPMGTSRAAPVTDRALEDRWEALAALAARLPPGLRFGTSSWSFPGWAGIVYPSGLDESRLARDGLPLYVRHPLLRTVGIDRGYYAPIAESELRRYASQLPPGFPCCSKVPEGFVSPVFLGHGRGERGEPNPDFLNTLRFDELVAGPYLSAFSDHLGPMILEFPPVPAAHRLAPSEFAERLDAFLEAAPKQLPFAVELRDRSLLTEEYIAVIARHGASHTYNYWTAMPMPGEQLKLAPPGAASFVVVRLMLRPGTRYEGRKRDFQPFDRLVDPDFEMRAQVTELVRLVTALGRNIFVLVNNKAEGCAPLTIEALAEACARLKDDLVASTEPATGT
ncbi:MAG: DUF72 domain-containing protein [Deltaproteobacteria bacterium]|nr:DUF72 domain-containing protein [Deltaproteobacteria bacterium]